MPYEDAGEAYMNHAGAGWSTGITTYVEKKRTEYEVNADTARFWRPQGLHAVWDGTLISYYKCRRGCGCLVWNPEDHIKNVCTEFNPVAGNE